MFFVQSCGLFCGSGFAVLSHLLHFSLTPHHRWIPLPLPPQPPLHATRETETSLILLHTSFRSCKHVICPSLSSFTLCHHLIEPPQQISIRVFFCSFSLHLTFVTIGNQSTNFIAQVEESLSSCLHREKISQGVMILKQRTPSP